MSDRDLYENVVLYLLYGKYQFRFFEFITQTHAGESPEDRPVDFYP